MSLLNDALRNAERRQKGSAPGATGVYTGGSPAASRSARWPVVLLVLAVVILLAGYGVSHWIVSPASGPEDDRAGDAQDTSETAMASGSIQRPAEAPASPEPEPEPQRVQETEPLAQAGPAPGSVSETPEPAVAEREPAPVAEPEPERELPVEPSKEPGGQAAADQLADRSAGDQEAEAPASQPIKQSGQSPEARDREASRNIRNHLAEGRQDEALRQLERITGEQSAPLSRRVLVRDMLANGQPDAALQWLPESVIAGDSELRLLRARALLAKGNAEAAVATLQSRVPSIEDHAAYRVTLATLLQQQERYSEAANHWGALIAWDDSRASWWAGLAITLEAQGNRQSAVRAYRQAARLPGLPSALADYVRQRLQALQAG